MLKNYLSISIVVLLRKKFLTFVNLFGTVLTLTVLVIALAVLESMLNPRGAQSQQDHVLVVCSLCLRGKAFGACSNPGFAFYERHIRPLQVPDRISYSTMPVPTSSYVDGRKITHQLRRVDAAYVEILRFDVIEGRTLAPDDLEQGRGVAVINRATAESLFPGHPANGRTILLGSDYFTVIGVVAGAAQGRPVKVILETPLLNMRQKIEASKIAKAGGAAFVKTCTGASPDPLALYEDVRLIRQTVGPKMGIEASGRVGNFFRYMTMLEGGATRVGLILEQAREILRGCDELKGRL